MWLFKFFHDIFVTPELFDIRMGDSSLIVALGYKVNGVISLIKLFTSLEEVLLHEIEVIAVILCMNSWIFDDG